MKLVFVGLSLSSSWGNGHATTYRALLRALSRAGHEVRFLEYNKPWYRNNRDLHRPDFCQLHFYDRAEELSIYRPMLQEADAIIVGSYVPEGPRVIDILRQEARGLFCYYDIDTPITLSALTRGNCEYLRPDQIPGFDIYWSFTGGPTLETLQRDWGAACARPLYCAVDTEIYQPQQVELNWDLAYLGTYSVDRQPKVESLLLEPARRLPNRRFAVAGPAYPETRHWPANVDRINHLPPGRHASFYCAQRFTLNVTREDMVRVGYAPSVRLFEAAACGTPICSDWWNGLDALFTPDEEIIIASDSDAVVTMLEQLSDAERREIGLAGRERVLSAHTADHRAQELITAIEDRAQKAVA